MTLREPEAFGEWQYAFYQKWYHSAIHALLSIYEFRYRTCFTISSITAKQAAESIQLLTKIGLVRRDEDGVYRPTDAFVTSGERWQSIAIQNFQKETITLSHSLLICIQRTTFQL